MQHEEQLERWLRKSDALTDLSNRKQPAQLVLDVSLWQLRRQFGRLPCFSQEVRVLLLCSPLGLSRPGVFVILTYLLFACTTAV